MDRDQYVEFVKDSALDLGKRAVMKYLAARVPFLAGGFPGWVAGLIVGKILTVAIKETEMGIFFLYIDMRVDQQASEFDAAAIAYHNAPPEEKHKYEKAYLDAFYKFASLKS